jgi:hypothetical protein
MADKEMQEVYEEFVLSYVKSHPKCQQLDAIAEIRKAFFINEMADPGIPALRNAVSSLIEKGVIQADEDSPLSKLSLAS